MKKKLLSVLILLNSGIVFSQELKLGDSAPPLSLQQWMRGKPVNEFEKGKIYVLDFWSISCQSCTSQFPHLSMLAKKYGRQAQIIGINVGESNNNAIATFIKLMGNKMKYSVAVDKGGFMIQNFLRPLTNMLPTTVIIGKTGLVEWAGNAFDIEDVLRKISTDQWEVETFKKQVAAVEPLDEIFRAIGTKPDWTTIQYEVKKKYPDLNTDSIILSWQYPHLGSIGDSQGKATVLIDYVEKYAPKLNSRLMNAYAWDVFSNSSDKRNLRKAASWLQSDAASIYPLALDTYANLLHKLGDKKEAIKAQRKALRLIDQDSYVDNLALTYYKILTDEPTWNINDGETYYSNNKVAWRKAVNSLKQYPELKADSLVLLTMVSYMKNSQKWSDFTNAIEDFNGKNKGSISGYSLNSFAWDVFKNSTNQIELEKALEWSEKSLLDSRYERYYHRFYDTKANIFHKLGRTEESIIAQKKAIELCPETEKGSYQATLVKIEKGEKTW